MKPDNVTSPSGSAPGSPLSSTSTGADMPALRLILSRSIPAIGLCVLGGVVMFAPLLEGGSTHGAVAIIRLMILLLLGLAVLGGVARGSLDLPRVRVGPAVLAFVGLAALSTLTSAYHHQSLQWFLVLLSYAGLLYFVVFFVTRWDHVTKLLALVVGVGLFEGGSALVQAWWVGLLRPAGTFFNPNFLAGYLGAIVAVVLGVLCYSRIRWPRWGPGWTWRRVSGADAMRRLAIVGTLILLLVAIVLTGSRGGVLALVVGTSFVCAIRFGRWGALSLLVAILVCVLVPNPVRDRLLVEHRANPVSYARWQMWQGSVHAMRDHPLGVGLGLYQYISPAYAFPVESQIARFGQSVRTPHNEYLQLGTELGPVSLLIVGWGLAGVLAEALWVLRRRLRRWQRGVVVGLCGGIAGILAHATVDSNLHAPAVAVLLTLYVGLLGAIGGLSRHRERTIRVIPIRFPWVWSVTVVLLVGVLSVLVARMGLAWSAYEDGSRAKAGGNGPTAMAGFQRAVNLDPGKSLYHSALAATHFQVFQASRDGAAAKAAADELRTAISLNPLDGRLYGVLGHVYMSLSAALRSSPDNQSAREDFLRSALAAYRRAADLEPYSPFYRLALGRLHLALGNNQEAEAVVQEAVTLEPNFLQGRAWLAGFYLDSGRPALSEVARREYQEILDRRERYAAWPKDSYERRLLTVDTSRLAGLLR